MSGTIDRCEVDMLRMASWWVFATFVLALAACDKMPAASPPKIRPVNQAAEIVKLQLKSPASFKMVGGETLWEGVTAAGNPAYVASVQFDAANSFGALLRGCMYVAFTETKDNKVSWNTSYGISDHSENYRLCDPSTPREAKAGLADVMVGLNFKGAKKAGATPAPAAAPAEPARPAEPRVAAVQPPVAPSPPAEPAARAVAAPSFDCAKAASVVEKLICSDAELAKLDVELNQAYSQARAAASDKEALKKAQLDWLKNSLKPCTDRGCVAETIGNRIRQLRS